MIKDLTSSELVYVIEIILILNASRQKAIHATACDYFASLYSLLIRNENKPLYHESVLVVHDGTDDKLCIT